MNRQDGGWSPYLAGALSGVVGVYLLNDLGMVRLSIKATILGPVIIGALVFGLGWGLLEYCPGTSMGAPSAKVAGTPCGASWAWSWGRAYLRKPIRFLKKPCTPGGIWAASPCLRFWRSDTGSSFPSL
jgi:hypothetical protein